MRLLYFDLTTGNRIGMQFILGEMGVIQGGRVISKLKYRELFDNPFKALNQNIKLTEQQRLSQRQMGPLVILYQLLKEEGYTQEDALDFCNQLSQKVAVAFLKFNIPRISKRKWKPKSLTKKLSKLRKLAARFFNAETESEVISDDEMLITITGCHFATYAHQLGVPELGPIFCAADQYYFDHFQPDIKFERTQTLAIDGKPCDFRFKWADVSDQ